LRTIRDLPNYIDNYPIEPDIVINPNSGKVNVAIITTSLSTYLIQKSYPRTSSDRTKINKFLINPQIVSSYKELYIEKLKYILKKHQVDFVAYGEYAFPFEGNRKKNDSFFNKLYKISRKYGVCILAGSYQDIKESNYNITLLFVPWKKDPFKFIKWLSAKNDGETTDTPNRRKLQVVQSPFGYFTSLACIDIADENFIKKVIFLNTYKEAISFNIFFNPSRDSSGESEKRVISMIRGRAIHMCF
jgi:hypothetical protein